MNAPLASVAVRGMCAAAHPLGHAQVKDPIQQHLTHTATVIADGLAYFSAACGLACKHEPDVGQVSDVFRSDRFR